MLQRLQRALGQAYRGPLSDLDALREKVVELSFFYVVVFAAPMALLSLHHALVGEGTWYGIVQMGAYLILLAAFLASRWISSAARGYLLVSIVLMVGISGVIAWGPAPSRFVILSCACVFAALFGGGRAAMAMLAISISALIAISVSRIPIGLVSGGDSISSHTPKQWFITIGSFAFYSSISALLVAWMNRSLQSSIAALKEHESEMERSNDLLQAQAVQLEEQAVQLEEQAEVLTEQRDRANAASRAKDSFLSVISHELRTPLNPILGFLDLIREDTSLCSESKTQLELMQRSGEHLLRMIERVVDYSELNRGELVINAQPVDWADFQSDVMARLQPRAHEKALSLSFQCCVDAVDKVLVFDRRRVLQIVEELGANALNFTESGSVSIRMRGLESRSAETDLSIEIVDTGCGIAEADLAFLFNPFTQANSEKTRKTNGFGLGLAACHTVVKAMGGEIAVQSELGVGSTFIVRIPVMIERREVAVASSRKDRNRVFDRAVEILVVEDDFVNQRVVTSLLKRMGAQATCVDNGQKALDTLRERSFDLVLMDVSMPVMDGITATREIRQTLNLATTPVIALTAHSFAGSEKDCLDAGMNAFLTKPVKSPKLFDTISSHLRKYDKIKPGLS